MPSPFPGMDPYVEPRWQSFHLAMIVAMLAGLNRALPATLEAWIGQWIGGELHGDTSRRVGPADDDDSQRPNRMVQIVAPDDGGRVVTAIELISRWHKSRGDPGRIYRAKRREYGVTGINWVELDLLRAPPTESPEPSVARPPEDRATYRAVIHSAVAGQRQTIPISLRDRLPTICVPLRAGEPEVLLDLQAAFDRAYDGGPFRYVDYTRTPAPPLSDADTAWAAEHVRPPAR